MSKLVVFLMVVVAAVLGFITLSKDDVRHTDGLLKLGSWTEVRTQAEQLGVPIILLVEQKNCGYCQRLKRDLFHPLANTTTYRSRALFVSVLTDFDEPLLEKDGVEVSGFEFAESFEASTTPTILFLSSRAEELQDRVIGYTEGHAYRQALLNKIEASIGLVSQ